MTREECKKLLMIIDASYPNFNAQDLTATINSWYLFLESYDYKEIELALKIFITTSGSAFAPSVSELIAAANKPRQLTEIDATTAWTQVRKAIKRGIYYAEEDFYSLPELSQKVIGYPEQIRSWAQMESREIDTVVASNFRRSYESLQRKKQELSAMPLDIQRLIQTAEQKMIEKREA